jgi:hypothetical protein
MSKTYSTPGARIQPLKGGRRFEVVAGSVTSKGQGGTTQTSEVILGTNLSRAVALGLARGTKPKPADSHPA